MRKKKIIWVKVITCMTPELRDAFIKKVGPDGNQSGTIRSLIKAYVGK